ncbi:tyrosine-type recombinase/integrase [Flavobacterium sp. CS20]|uniref:tyrosine-type recombinase/integrase n=1 Tax=Flavobacterium sp. CS20 TaxID=2775246 RepID=UPI001B39E98A|nr:tyrosine-type recombinase/integrase [Flavobacterium sp. CS20]QTY27175.1 tyrosine-type recombinase/integrase [Flavobacterium sp. CS20]
MSQITTFLSYLENEKQYSKHTIIAYQNDLKGFSQFLKDNFDDLSVIDVDYFQVESWIAELSQHNLKHKSINRKLSSLKTFYMFLLKTDQIKTSPMQKLKSLKTPKPLSTPFSIQEVENVINSFEPVDFKSSRQALIIELLYATGMRRAELISLQTKDVDLAKQQLKITGKRNKQRIIPLYNKICESIKNYLQFKKHNGLSHPNLLVTDQDEPLYPSLVYHVVNNAFSEFSSKSKTSPHILRHTFATHLLNQGSDLNAIKELLGHESLSSTEIYTHNSIEQLKQSYFNNHPRESK